MAELAITVVVWCGDGLLGDDATKWQLDDGRVHWNCGG